MRYKDIEIIDLTNEQLIAASFQFDGMHKEHLAIVETEKYKNKFKNQPTPEINPKFLQLRDEIQKELSKRNLNNG